MTTMSAIEATTFTRRSQTNKQILTQTARARNCTCRPYVDWFTYARWQAQGFQVRKGERSTHLAVYIEIDELTADGRKRKIRKTACVFCRCQVDPK